METDPENDIVLQASSNSLMDQPCWLIDLPQEILEIIIDFLPGKDVNSLSQTCQKFYTFINNENFWQYFIHRHFPKSIAQLYTFDLFQKSKVIETYNEIQQLDIINIRPDDQFDLLAINSATHYSDEAVQKCHRKMYVSKDDFLTNIDFFQFNKFNKSINGPLNKIIYFYLIDRKRCAVIDMNVAHRDKYGIVDEYHPDCLTGHVLHLHSGRSLDISGRLEHKIMPGKYEVSWRMKSDACSVYVPGVTEFIVVPQHGKLIIHRMLEDDFCRLIYQSKDYWSLLKIGQTIIYEPSTVLVAIRNWINRDWKYGLLLDCVEFKIVS